MKVKARANGNIIELPEETAEPLISSGIYDAVTDDPSDDPARTPDEPRTHRKRAAR